jgi:RNAse (barnase) inhibitor barstar
MQIDGKLIKEDGHDYLMEVLNLPDYYGKNLDALYDCLCEMDEEIVLINPEDVDKDIIDTFKDASEENEFLKFEILY